MASHHVRHSVIVDDQGKIKGVISDRDVLRALARTPDWKTKPVSEIMTHEPFVVNPRTRWPTRWRSCLKNASTACRWCEEDGKVCWDSYLHRSFEIVPEGVGRRGSTRTLMPVTRPLRARPAVNRPLKSVKACRRSRLKPTSINFRPHNRSRIYKYAALCLGLEAQFHKMCLAVCNAAKIMA